MGAVLQHRNAKPPFRIRAAGGAREISERHAAGVGIVCAAVNPMIDAHGFGKQDAV